MYNEAISIKYISFNLVPFLTEEFVTLGVLNPNLLNLSAVINDELAFSANVFFFFF